MAEKRKKTAAKAPSKRPPQQKKQPRNKNEKYQYNSDGTVTRLVKKKERLFGVRAGLDLPFLLLTITLVIIGLIMMFSASYYYAYHNEGSSFYYIIRQGIFAILGLALMFGISFVDYHILHRLTIPILVLSWLLLIIVRILPATEGVHRWISLGLFGFQPSEIAKFAIVLWFAHYISKHFTQMKTFKYGVLPNIFVLGLTAFLIVIEPHFSATIIVLLLAGIMLFVGGVQKRWFAIALIFLALAATCLLLFTDSYAGGRVQGWLNPFNTELWQDTWQTRNSLYAIGSGGFFGLGLGQSRQKYLWLPEPQNDFIFAIVCEELGFVGAMVVILLFVLLVWRGVRIALKAKDKFGMLLGVGLSLQVGIQVALNIAVVTNTIPNTGISLPFFSYGGTSLIILLAQMGVILSISRTSSIEKV
ncbi:MAG: putative lipid II flippase FtsW [Oscillospiraceae bacterium]|nr:putative lipid II flippase FtsW [Oscillospiraceae bacterium]